VSQAEYQKKYREENKERLAAWRKAYYQQNKERRLTQVRQRYIEKKEQLLAYAKAWREANPEKCYAMKKQWRAKNPEKAREWSKLHQRRKRESVPGFRARCNISRRMSAMLRGNPNAKNKRLGVTAQQLRAHLEPLFQPGMTWENYGKVWHVDHIKPCALFDFSDPEQIKACFSLANLQPLWAAENIRKSDQFPYVPSHVAA